MLWLGQNLDLSVLDPDQGLGHLQQMLGHLITWQFWYSLICSAGTRTL